MSKIEEYVNEIPEEIRRAIRGLDNDSRAAIFVALLKHGELSFSDLQKKLEIDKAKLYFHLGKLIESALVKHYYKHELGRDEYSFYSTTKFGNHFVEALIQSLEPKPIWELPSGVVPTVEVEELRGSTRFVTPIEEPIFIPHVEVTFSDSTSNITYTTSNITSNISGLVFQTIRPREMTISERV